MSYTLVGVGATYSAPIATARPRRFLLRAAPPSDAGNGTANGTPGFMDPGQITPERCRAAGWYWDEVALQCLEEAPPQPAPQPDPTVPPPPVPPPPLPVEPSPEQLCAEAGGCWDPMQMDCFVCMDEEAEPAAPPPVVAEPAPEEDNTALYAGIGLLLAAGLAGGYFLISRKKKKGKP